MNSHIELNHIIFYVENAKKSSNFYQNLLGVSIIEEAPGYARLSSPQKSFTIGIHEFEEGMFPPLNEGITIYFEVSDLDMYCSSLKDKGYIFDQLPKEMPWGWRHAYLTDHDGHKISLYHAGEKRFEKTPGFE
ncbi:MAG: VOC family protein [Candidatus Hodarchaeales archaeon]|jgi:predicted enzyme related to lactoylglutathione lyase